MIDWKDQIKIVLAIIAAGLAVVLLHRGLTEGWF